MGGGSNPINDLIDTAAKAVSDTFDELERTMDGSGIHLDPYVKQKQEAKDEKKKAAREKAAAAAKAKKDREDAIRRKAKNAEASKGATIMLGGKSKKKGGSVSSGMGLSKGKTGLQV